MCTKMLVEFYVCTYILLQSVCVCIGRGNLFCKNRKYITYMQTKLLVYRMQLYFGSLYVYRERLNRFYKRCKNKYVICKQNAVQLYLCSVFVYRKRKFIYFSGPLPSITPTNMCAMDTIAICLVYIYFAEGKGGYVPPQHNFEGYL